VDWWKVVIIVLLLMIVVGFLAQIAGIDFGQTAGKSAIYQLSRPGEDAQHNTPEWSPLDVARQLFPMMLDTGLPGFHIFQIITGAFGAAFLVVGIAVVLKIILKIAG
jgi:hypothetical protein